METNIKYKEEWLSLAKHGKFILAENLYYEKLFPEIIKVFKSKFSSVFNGEEVLISILGYSPEPIILTANVVRPIKHYIITTEFNDNIINRIEEHLENDFNIITLADDSFSTIYKTLKEILYDTNMEQIILDITGGKKSMVASSAIFGKDYQCKITYVDSDQYIKELRKPMPGSERLSIVYDPTRDQPEIQQF